MINAISEVLINILDALYNLTHSYGWAIVLFTVLIKVALYPLTQKQFKSMKEMQILQPEIKKLQEKHKGNQQLLQKELMELYQRYKINPFAGCMPLIIQMPILIALYNAIKSYQTKLAGSEFLWIGNEVLQERFPNLIGDSLASPDMPLLLLYGVSMIFSSKLTTVSTPETAKNPAQNLTTYILPVMLIVLFKKFPSAFILYWFVFNLLSIVHQSYYLKQPLDIEIKKEITPLIQEKDYKQAKISCPMRRTKSRKLRKKKCKEVNINEGN